MKKKNLIRGKGFNSLFLLILFAALVIFFFAYGQDAIQRAVDKLQAEPTPNGQLNLNGLGPAILMVYVLIFTLSLAVPALLLFIAAIGNLVTKKYKSVGFTVTSMIAELISMPILFLLTVFIAGATLHDKLTLIVYISVMVFTVISFLWSIVALGLRKKATE